jgi:hypothetical protein
VGYLTGVPNKVREETRALLCRGHRLSSSSEEIADALHAWTLEHGGALGDMSLQLVVHGADLAESEWEEAPFLVGVVVREAFGLDGDHELGLTSQELEARVHAADARLDELAPSLAAVLEPLGVSAGERKLLFSRSGPLCSAHLVRGVRRDEAPDDEAYFWSVGEGQPGYFFARMGASQDEVPVGAFGLEVACAIADNFDPPFEVTLDRLAAVDTELAKHGIVEPRLFVFPQYD